MARTRVWLRLPVIILIVTLAAGCDNVTWGGVDVAVVPPPAKSASDTAAAVDSTATARARLPAGPVLYYVRAGRHGAFMAPIAEVAGDSLRALRPRPDVAIFDSLYSARFLARGSDFTLYRGGERAGTFVLGATTPPDSGLCPALPLARGQVELLRGAEADTEFLAMAEARAVPSFRLSISPRPTPTMRRMAPILAERLLRARDAKLPGNWRVAIRQIVPFPVRGATAPGFTATLLEGGRLDVGADHAGRSLYFVAAPRRTAGYDTVFTQYADFASGGKLATRTVDYLDWNGNGRVALITESYDASQRWFGAVASTARGWRQVFNGRCATGSAIPAALPAPTGTVPTGSRPPGRP